MNDNTYKYRLVIEFDPGWLDGMGIDALTEHLRAKLELALGAYPHSRGRIKRFQRTGKAGLSR